MSRRDLRDPERWEVRGDAPPELRALLDVAGREGPSLVQKASLIRRLGSTFERALAWLRARLGSK